MKAEDENGKKLFTDADRPILEESVDSRMVTVIAAKILARSDGAATDDVGELAKNLGATLSAEANSD